MWQKLLNSCEKKHYGESSIYLLLSGDMETEVNIYMHSNTSCFKGQNLYSNLLSFCLATAKEDLMHRCTYIIKTWGDSA